MNKITYWEHQTDFLVPEMPVLPEDLLTGLVIGHPRLHVRDFKALSDKIASVSRMSTWYDIVRKQAELLVEDGSLLEDVPPKERLLQVSRTALLRMYKLGLCYNIEKSRKNREACKYSSQGIKELLNLCSFPDWHPFDFFLDCAEMIHVVSIGYDWFYHVLENEQRNFIVSKIISNGLEEALKFYTGERIPNEYWVKKVHNINFVNNSGIGIGALAIADLDRDYANRILHYGIDSIYNIMPAFQPDGAWYEGPMYWYYGTRYLAYFFSSLQSSVGTDFGIPDYPCFPENGYFSMYLAAPSRKQGSNFNYADSFTKSPGGEQFFWFAKRFDKPEYMWWELKMADREPLPYHILWYDPSFYKSPSEVGLPLDKHFRYTEVTTFRSAWDDENGTFLGIKGRKTPFLNHCDIDAGTFYLEAHLHSKEVLWQRAYAVFKSATYPFTDIPIFFSPFNSYVHNLVATVIPPCAFYDFILHSGK